MLTTLGFARLTPTPLTLRCLLIPQTVLALRGSRGVGLVPGTCHVWSRGSCRRAVPELPRRMPPLSHSHHHFGKLSIFCEVFAEGSLPERHSQVLRWKKVFFCKTETFVFWHMTEISARNLVENDRTDVPHLFGFGKIIRNQENQILIKVYGWHFVKIWSGLEVGQKSQNLESSQNGLAYNGKS